MKNKTTLSALLSVVAPNTEVLIIRHMGADCYEAVAAGAAQEGTISRCLEVCGGSKIEKIAIEQNGYPWSAEATLIVTIGPRGAK